MKKRLRNRKEIFFFFCLLTIKMEGRNMKERILGSKIYLVGVPK